LKLRKMKEESFRMIQVEDEDEVEVKVKVEFKV
jgi:hypothetical protein